MSASEIQNADILRARRDAAQRQRRLIVDDDGDGVYGNATQDGPEAFCNTRLKSCADVSVDSIAWCIMWGICPKGSNPVRYWQTQLRGVPFQESMPDPTLVVEQFCRGHGMEVFGSIRMNDCHDAFGYPHGKLVYPLKVEHPEFLIGDESQKATSLDGLEAAMWSGLDYAHETVREDRFRWIEHTATEYDLDGVDLNFFRMPWVFRLGEEAEHMHLLTDLVRRARRLFDETGCARGRPLLLGVRVPDTVETCLRIGIDIETWLEEELVDRLLSGGGYAAFSTPAEELVALGHRHDVPVYPCINCPCTFDLGAGAGFEALRGAASNMWQAGADGIYLWNYQYLPTPHIACGQAAPEDYAHLPDLADPDRLRHLDKVFAVNHPSLEQYARATAPCPLPVSLGERAGGAPRVVPVRIGDDIGAASKSGALKDLTLQLDLAGAAAGDRLNVRFNGAPVGNGALQTGKSPSMRAGLDPVTVKQGVNELAVSVEARGPEAGEGLTLNQVRVCVRYD